MFPPISCDHCHRQHYQHANRIKIHKGNRRGRHCKALTKLGGLLGVMEKLEPNERGTIRMDMKDDGDVHFIPEGQ